MVWLQNPVYHGNRLIKINEHAIITYEQVSLDEDQFREETMKALTRQELGIMNFVYSAVKKGSTLELTWKKHILSDNIKFLLGSVTLSLCRDQGATKLLDFAVSALVIRLAMGA